jgi:[ribosomal protein S18]-alanine N-acetyltransferase
VRFTVRNHRPDEFETLWKIDQSCFVPGIAYSRYELKAYMGRGGAFTLVVEADGESIKGNGGDGESLNAGEVHKNAGEVHKNNEDRILGFLVAECGRRRIGHIITIDVRSEARRHRVGSALLDAAESRLRAAQCQLVRLETAVDNLAALSFYKRRGYNVIETIPRYYSSGVDALLLEKDLLLPVASG